MAIIIEKNNLIELAKDLQKIYKIIIPQKIQNEIVFDYLTDESEVDLDYENLNEYKNTILPPKKFFLPNNETLFIYDKEKKKLKKEKISTKKQLIFGISLNDLKGILFLDEIMASPPADYFYFKNRNQFILLAITDKIIDSKIYPTDITLQKINTTKYIAIANTKEGKKIIKSKHFKKVDIVVPPENTIETQLTNLQKLLLDSELLSNAIEWSWKNSKIWDELSEICLGCGICTYVCPLCYCFSIEDKILLDKKTCLRCRNWDACTLPNFAKIASGKNFRPTIKERYYNWYYHKFVRGYNEYGKSLCIGCARCQKYCPAKIDIEQILNRILKEYKNNQKNFHS